VGPRGGAALTPRRPRRIKGRALARRLAGCCPAAAGLLSCRLSEASLGELPDDLIEGGLLAEEDGYWLWASPRRIAPAGSPPQALIRLPQGRYRLDFFDTGSREWIASESGAAAPLVVSLPFRGAPLVVRVRRLAGEPASRPDK
jgi:hypothetical protein